MKKEEITKAILNTAAQVYILVGPAGLGKRRYAEEIAAQILGIRIEALATHPDYIVLPAAGLNDVREMLSRLGLRSMFGQRIGVIPAVDRLSVPAQNALLKTLEEPTQGTLLLLLAENEEEILPTIRSRAVVARLPLPTRKEVAAEFGEQLASLARGLPSLARDLQQNEELRAQTQRAREDAQEFLRAPLWKRLVLAGVWTKESKKKGGTISPTERLLALEDIARNAAQVGDAQAARLLAALPQAFADIQQNTNTTVLFETLAIALR